MRRILGVVLFLMAPLMALQAAQRVDLGTIDENVKVTVLEANQSKTVIRFEIGGFSKEAVRIGNEIYFKLDLEGEGNSLVEGDCRLPHRGLHERQPA